MKKVKVLFSAFALVAVVSGVFAAKAQVEDTVYTPNAAFTFCDQPLNFTLLPNGDPVGQRVITATPDIIAPLHCSLQNYYPRF